MDFEIMKIIYDDKELANLYLNDISFHNSIKMAISLNMNTQDSLIFAIKNICNIKNEVLETYFKACHLHIRKEQCQNIAEEEK